MAGMFDFTTTNENLSAVPAGRYKAKIAAVQSKNSKVAGDPMLALTLEITEGEYAGRQVFDNIMLVGPGAPMGKKKARGIIGDEVDTVKVPADVMANALLDRMVLIDVDTEDAFTKDPNTQQYTMPAYEIDANGARVRAKKNTLQAYYQIGALNGVAGSTGVTPTAGTSLLSLPQAQPQFAPPPQYQAPQFQPMHHAQMQQITPGIPGAPGQLQTQVHAPQYQAPAPQAPAPVQVHPGQVAPQMQPAPQMQFTQPPVTQAQAPQQAPQQAQGVFGQPGQAQMPGQPAQLAPQAAQAQVPQPQLAGFQPQASSTPAWIAAQQAPGSVQGQVEAGTNSSPKGRKKS